MTAMGPSSLTVVDHGDAAGPDSRGLFQQRASWGTYAHRMNPAKSAAQFYQAAKHNRSSASGAGQSRTAQRERVAAPCGKVAA